MVYLVLIAARAGHAFRRRLIEVGVLVVMLAGLLMPTQANADEQTRVGLAREIIQQTKAAELARAGIALMMPAQMAILRKSAGLTDAEVASFEKEFLAAWDASTPVFVDQTAKAYAELFSEAELASIRDFYASSAGQAFVSRQPDLMAKGQKIGFDIGAQAGKAAMEKILAQRAAKPDKS